MTGRATDSKGNGYDLALEYAAEAPGFFGLDQVNLVVPAELDGAGTVSLVISTEDAASNVVAFQMNLLPAGSLRLAGIALTPGVVNAGDNMTATVSLNGVARGGGFPVALRSSNLAAQPQPLVTIPEGKASAQGTVRTSSAGNGTQTGTISAQAQGATVSADFEIDAANQAQLSGLSISPGSVLGGRSVTGTVNLTAPAGAAGADVQIASDSALVKPPAMVRVPFNQSTAMFSIGTAAVTSAVDATVTATLGRDTVTAKLRLLAPLSLSIDTAAVTGGTSATVTVTLGDPAPPGGALIAINSNDAVATPPSTLRIAAGQNSGTFTVATSAVTSAHTVAISAMYQGGRRRFRSPLIRRPRRFCRVSRFRRITWRAVPRPRERLRSRRRRVRRAANRPAEQRGRGAGSGVCDCAAGFDQRDVHDHDDPGTGSAGGNGHGEHGECEPERGGDGAVGRFE